MQPRGSLQAGSSVENGARSKHPLPLKMARGRNIRRGCFERAPFSTEEPACRLTERLNQKLAGSNSNSGQRGVLNQGSPDFKATPEPLGHT